MDQAYALAEDMVESMQSQMERGFGIWLSDGVTTDSLTGFWRTSSSSFEAAIVEGGVDEDLVEMVIDKKISGNVRRASSGTVRRATFCSCRESKWTGKEEIER